MYSFFFIGLFLSIKQSHIYIVQAFLYISILTTEENQLIPQLSETNNKEFISTKWWLLQNALCPQGMIISLDFKMHCN